MGTKVEVARILAELVFLFFAQSIDSAAKFCPKVLTRLRFPLLFCRLVCRMDNANCSWFAVWGFGTRILPDRLISSRIIFAELRFSKPQFRAQPPPSLSLLLPPPLLPLELGDVGLLQRVAVDVLLLLVKLGRGGLVQAGVVVGQQVVDFWVVNLLNACD